MKKQKLIEFFIDNDFNVSESDKFKPDNSEFSFMYNKEIHKGVIIKAYELFEGTLNTKDVLEDVRFTKSILSNKNYNIWNIYYLILIEEDIDFDNRNYSIERNYKNLRKYIIHSESDLKRIPFLESAFNDSESFSIGSDLYDLIINTEEDESDLIIKEIINNDGEHFEISKKKIENIIKTNLVGGNWV